MSASVYKKFVSLDTHLTKTVVNVNVFKDPANLATHSTNQAVAVNVM